MVPDLTSKAPTIAEIRSHAARLAPWLLRTPVVRCRNLEESLEFDGELHGKLEFLQQTGTFKPRGALANVFGLDQRQLRDGITAVSAGNHAIAAAFAARAVGTHAKVVMFRGSSPVRIYACRELGAEVVIAADVHDAFEVADDIVTREGRTYVHPFEGPGVATGTGTLGLEICEQVPELDAVVVPIGGGGLCAGIAAAVKQLNPRCKVYGVEPVGADSMSRSLRSGRPEKLGRVDTIADSLGAPFALPYSFGLGSRYVDDIVLVEDDALRDAMRILFREMKIAVEPACAASTAAVKGPLRERLLGKKTALVFCGSNIDGATFIKHAGLH